MASLWFHLAWTIILSWISALAILLEFSDLEWFAMTSSLQTTRLCYQCFSDASYESLPIHRGFCGLSVNSLAYDSCLLTFPSQQTHDGMRRDRWVSTCGRSAEPLGSASRPTVSPSPAWLSLSRTTRTWQASETLLHVSKAQELSTYCATATVWHYMLLHWLSTGEECSRFVRNDLFVIAFGNQSSVACLKAASWVADEAIPVSLNSVGPFRPHFLSRTLRVIAGCFKFASSGNDW